MNTETNPFLEIKFHPSSVSSLMGNLPGLTEVQERDLAALESRKSDPNARPLTDKMKEDMARLRAKRDAPDELPDGAITELDKIYREVVWNRKDVVEVDTMEKGNLVEQDCLGLASRVDKTFYKKNNDIIENEWLIGTPDQIERKWKIVVKVRDTKANWGMSQHDTAKLTIVYAWQVKAYSWILGCTEGEVIYCLVNSPPHLITKEIEKYWYRYGQPDSTDERWMKLAALIERNHIFDFDLFELDNPGWDFNNRKVTHDDKGQLLDNPYFEYNVPEQDRVKRFEVELTEDDIAAFKLRLPTCRQYLIDKWNKRFLK